MKSKKLMLKNYSEFNYNILYIMFFKCKLKFTLTLSIFHIHAFLFEEVYNRPTENVLVIFMSNIYDL